jgi:hypothetical protein
LRLYPKCFVGEECVDWIIAHTDIEVRQKAVELGNIMHRYKLLHHVTFDHVFKDEFLFYRFQEDEESQCLNEKRLWVLPQRPARQVLSTLNDFIFKILTQYLTDDGTSVNYNALRTSRLYREFIVHTAELQTIDFGTLTEKERKAYLINIYNILVIHSQAEAGKAPDGAIERMMFFKKSRYKIGRCTYSLTEIENGLLRSNSAPPSNTRT